MITPADFKRLPEDGIQFESLVCQLLEAMGFRILESPAQGADGGRDILVENVERGVLRERREKVVVQCKHFAHSGRAVSERDLGIWVNSLIRYHADIYLLVTSTYITENLNRVFIEYSRGSRNTATVWNADKLVDLLNRNTRIRDTFFPPTRPNLGRLIGEYGWGAIFPSECDTAIRESLEPLLNLRKEQVEKRGMGKFCLFTEEQGYQRGESAPEFLNRHNVGPGEPDPSRVPFFLAIIGDANEVPFSFQAHLGMQYAVGRIAFDSPEDYARYANSVVRAEEGEVVQAKELTLVALEHENDEGTRLSSEALVTQLHESLSQEEHWDVRLINGSEGRKDRLVRVFGGQEATPLVLTASHGLIFKEADSRRDRFQGAMVTADWPGAGHIPTREHYLSAEDVTDDARLGGMIVFAFSCASAGTPLIDEYQRTLSGGEIAAKPFVSAFPKRLLSHPLGGALAFIGHVGLCWQSSFLWNGTPQPQTIREVLRRLMKGEPVGVAAQALSRRYAELAVMKLSLESLSSERRPSASDLDSLSIAMTDARDYIVLGDPAVRLNLA